MTTDTTTLRADRVRGVFRERFGGDPVVGCRAPGRVDLMGSHTDYNHGHVLTLPIDRDTWIAARPRRDRRVRVFSMNLDAETEFDLDHLVADPGVRWADYVKGVAQVLQEEGRAATGFDGVLHSTVPIGSGLSSSAALECAVATLFEVLGGWRLAPVDKARWCQRAENWFVGVPCGILDQYTSCAGREGCALLLDCRDLTSRPVPLPEGVGVVIGDTRSRRELAASEYAGRRAQCEEGARRLGAATLREAGMEVFTRRERELPPETARRCRFILEEDTRVLKLAEALGNGDRPALGRLTAASFRGACELFEIGAPAMRAMHQAMLAAPGVLGARQAGAGFGGCLVAFVRQAGVDAFAASVRGAYQGMTGVPPEVFPVAAAAGAGPVEALSTGGGAS